MNYWLFKTEPETFSIHDLEKRIISGWDGVRNYQARNFMRDQMNVGDRAFIYHSSCEAPGIYGEAVVCETGLVDPTQFDSTSKYYDPKSTIALPRWQMVSLKFQSKRKTPLLLSTIRTIPELKNLFILQKGNRLSITPLTKSEFDYLTSL